MSTTITLLEKVRRGYSLKAFEHALTSLFEELNVQLKVVNKTYRGWIQIEVSGEDETVALHHLREKVGFAPESIDKIRKFLTVRGKVIRDGENGSNLCVDVGVFTPETYDAIVSLEKLQAQLADGKKMHLQELRELFCLCDNMPLKVKIIDDSDNEGKCFAAELSEAQISQFTRWVRSSLDRLIVFGVPASYVTNGIGKSNLSRDIIGVEELGILEHSILCKMGTDAVGLIPKLGPRLPTANFAAGY